MKIHNTVKILEIDLDRECCTEHGQHLNLSGKEISLRLAAVIRNFFNKTHLVPFSMLWEEVPSTVHQETNLDCFNNYASKTEKR